MAASHVRSRDSSTRPAVLRCTLPTQYRSTSARSAAAVVADAPLDVVVAGGAPACEATTTLVAANTIPDRLDNLRDMSRTEPG